jgi:hypothetical protein
MIFRDDKLDVVDRFGFASQAMTRSCSAGEDVRAMAAFDRPFGA